MCNLPAITYVAINNATFEDGYRTVTCVYFLSSGLISRVAVTYSYFKLPAVFCLTVTYFLPDI